MEPRRIVVGTSFANVEEGSDAPLVGVLSWSKFDDEFCSIIVKARVHKRAPRKILRPKTFFARPRQADEAQRPVDFVPARGCVNVCVVGHVQLPGMQGQPVRLAGALVAGGDSTTLAFEAGGPGKIPLALPYVRIPGVEGAEGSLAPRNLHDGALLEFKYPEDFDYDVTHTAPVLLRREKLAESSKIVILAMIAGQPEPLVELPLPPFTPKVMVDPSVQGKKMVSVYPYLDTVLVDADKEELELTWRAYYRTISGVADIDRVLVGWAPEGDNSDRTDKQEWRAILRELPRGQFEYAWFFKDADEGRPPDPMTPEREKFARLQTWSYPLAPEPRLDLDKYAEVTVELAQQREPRAVVLARHGLSDPNFALEERGWVERVTMETRKHLGHSPSATHLTEARERARARLGLPPASSSELAGPQPRSDSDGEP